MKIPIDGTLPDIPVDFPQKFEPVIAALNQLHFELAKLCLWTKSKPDEYVTEWLKIGEVVSNYIHDTMPTEWSAFDEYFLLSMLYMSLHERFTAACAKVKSEADKLTKSLKDLGADVA